MGKLFGTFGITTNVNPKYVNTLRRVYKALLKRDRTLDDLTTYIRGEEDLITLIMRDMVKIGQAEMDERGVYSLTGKGKESGRRELHSKVSKAIARVKSIGSDR